jgi:hypothetical protein
MKTTPAGLQTILSCLVLATMPGVPALADIQVTATMSLTIKPTGPRKGNNGSRYFNVEGIKNDKATGGWKSPRSRTILPDDVPSWAASSMPLGQDYGDGRLRRAIRRLDPLGSQATDRISPPLVPG